MAHYNVETKEISKDTFKPATQNPWDSFQAKTKTSNLILDKTIDIKNEASILIYNLNRKESINFNLVPETLADTYKAKFTTESNIYGRTTPLYFYSGGDSKSLSFSFSIHEDLLPKITDNKSTNLYTFLETLRSYTMPDILKTSKGQTIKGPEIYLQIGSHFAGKGYFTIDWAYRLPYRNGRYIVADVNISFTYIIEYDMPKVQLLEEDTGSTVLIDKILEESAMADELTRELDNLFANEDLGFIKDYYINVEQNLNYLNWHNFDINLVDFTDRYLALEDLSLYSMYFENNIQYNTRNNPYDLLLMYYTLEFYNLFVNGRLNRNLEETFALLVVPRDKLYLNETLSLINNLSNKVDILIKHFLNTAGIYYLYENKIVPTDLEKEEFKKKLEILRNTINNTRNLLQNLLGGRS